MEKNMNGTSTNSTLMESSPYVASVIVATRNRAANLRRCIASLQAMEPVKGRWEILVVDNNSHDETPAVAREAAAAGGQAEVRYLFAGRRGKSEALNAGIVNARGAVVAFTDDDCLLDSLWLKNVLGLFEADPDLAVLGGRVELFDQRDKHVSIIRCEHQVEIPQSRVLRALFGTMEEIDRYGSVIGANSAVRRSAFTEIGMFDVFLAPGTTREPMCSEDSDFVYRACRAGLKVVYSPAPLVYHNHGRRTDEDLQSITKTYTRGRGAFYFKHAMSGDIPVLKMAYWEIKDYSLGLLSLKLEPAKRKNFWRVMLLLFSGMMTQLKALGRNRMGRSAYSSS
jgi:GT2 family glycosyltransferase